MIFDYEPLIGKDEGNGTYFDQGKYVTLIFVSIHYAVVFVSSSLMSVTPLGTENIHTTRILVVVDFWDHEWIDSVVYVQIL